MKNIHILAFIYTARAFSQELAFSKLEHKTFQDSALRSSLSYLFKVCLSKIDRHGESVRNNLERQLALFLERYKRNMLKDEERRRESQL